MVKNANNEEMYPAIMCFLVEVEEQCELALVLDPALQRWNISGPDQSLPIKILSQY